MTANKSKKQETAPVEKKQRSYAWVYTFATVVIGVACAILILGLATRGLATYIKGMGDQARTTASIVGVALMAFGVASLIKLGKR